MILRPERPSCLCFDEPMRELGRGAAIPYRRRNRGGKNDDWLAVLGHSRRVRHSHCRSWDWSLLNPAAIVLVFSVFFTLTVGLCLVWANRYQKVKQDIESRVAEVIEGAPEQVWLSRGFCYLGVAGLTIRVPNDYYGDLRQSNKVKVAFLPTALVAVKVECFRGMGLSPTVNWRWR